MNGGGEGFPRPAPDGESPNRLRCLPVKIAKLLEMNIYLTW
jgi:hypothetical protein